MASTWSTGVAPANSPAAVHGNIQQSEVCNNDSHRDAEPINPLLLASACCGSSGALNFLFSREDAEEPPMTIPTQVFLDLLHRSRLTVQQDSDDVEHGIELTALQATASEDAAVLPAADRLLKGVTAVGDTALHVVATHGDSTQFLECASIINTRDQGLLFVVNRNGDTPLHCAARAGKSQMLSRLIVLAGTGYRMLQLLRKENGQKETALHEAIRIGNQGIVECLLLADPELGLYPVQGTSPLYLAILQRENTIAEKLHSMSRGNLSYDGPQGKTALHAAIFQSKGITELMLNWNNSLTAQGDIDGSTPLHLASSFYHSAAFEILFEANPATVFQADNEGLLPIHVAASVGAVGTIRIILEHYPSCAGLRTAQGRTFLHVAVEHESMIIVDFVCRAASLAWILNMQDNGGNTALHLAVQAVSLPMFGSLYANKGVHLSLENNNKQTPLDISRSLLPIGIYFTWNSGRRIYVALLGAGAKRSNLRRDQTEKEYSLKLNPEQMVKVEERVKDSSQTLGIGSVLVATMAFGATIAVPGGFIADDRTNRGTPTLAGSYTFDAFMMANTLAFICSTIATIGLMYSGVSLGNLRTRTKHLNASGFFMSNSLTSLSAAFALAVYMVLAPVARPTAIAVCVLSPLVVLYTYIDEVMITITFYLQLLKNNFHRPRWSLGVIILVCSHLWPFIIIFGWAAIAQKLRNH